MPRRDRRRRSKRRASLRRLERTAAALEALFRAVVWIVGRPPTPSEDRPYRVAQARLRGSPALREAFMRRLLGRLDQRRVGWHASALRQPHPSLRLTVHQPPTLIEPLRTRPWFEIDKSGDRRLVSLGPHGGAPDANQHEPGGGRPPSTPET